MPLAAFEHLRLSLLTVPMLVVATAGCTASQAGNPRFDGVEGGDAQRGQRLLAQYQCGSCHAIPAIPSAGGRTGPSLAAFGQRSYIAGEVANTPPALVRWLQDPQALVPDTRMPDMGVTESDARDMAAFLLTLR